MAHKKRIGLSIDAELNDRWTKVAKRLKITKSGMIEELLEEVLPVLEAKNAKSLVEEVFGRIGRGMTEFSEELRKVENEK